MKVGITGHQRREGADWNWVDEHLTAHLRSIGAPFSGYSSLAEGADQLFAKTVLKVGGQLHAVIPMEDYERHFDSVAALAGYRWLLSWSSEIRLRSREPAERAFLKAGEWIVAHVDRLIAVWDEHPAAGPGGTADIVAGARDRGIAILVINPVNRTLRRIPSCR